MKMILKMMDKGCMTEYTQKGPHFRQQAHQVQVGAEGMDSEDADIGRVGGYVDQEWKLITWWELPLFKHLLLPGPVIYAFNILSI